MGNMVTQTNNESITDNNGSLAGSQTLIPLLMTPAHTHTHTQTKLYILRKSFKVINSFTV